MSDSCQHGEVTVSLLGRGGVQWVTVVLMLEQEVTGAKEDLGVAPNLNFPHLHKTHDLHKLKFTSSDLHTPKFINSNLHQTEPKQTNFYLLRRCSC